MYCLRPEPKKKNEINVDQIEAIYLEIYPASSGMIWTIPKAIMLLLERQDNEHTSFRKEPADKYLRELAATALAVADRIEKC